MAVTEAPTEAGYPVSAHQSVTGLEAAGRKWYYCSGAAVFWVCDTGHLKCLPQREWMVISEVSHCRSSSEMRLIVFNKAGSVGSPMDGGGCR